MIADIRRHLEAAPFEPFTIVTSSGKRYAVASADHASVNPTGTRVVVWFNDDASVTIAGLHVVALEKGLSKSNGERSTRLVRPWVSCRFPNPLRWERPGKDQRPPPASRLCSEGGPWRRRSRSGQSPGRLAHQDSFARW